MRKIKVSEAEDVEIQCIECCGIEELYNLGEKPNEVLLFIANNSARRAMIIFHDSIERKNGEKLCSKIRRYKLGKVSSSNAVLNPNSMNMIRLWTWYPNFEALDKLVDERFIVKNYWDD